MLLRSGEPLTAGLIGAGCRAGMQRFVPLVLGVTFLVTPSVSTRIFKTFLCASFRYSGDDDEGSRRYLYADLSISCDGDEYEEMRTTAFVMMACWPIGVPILYMVLLVASRRAIRSGVPTPLSRAVAFMTNDYERSAFFWEPIEMCRKLTLTGFVLLIGEQSEQARVLVALLVCIVCLTLRLSIKPLERCARRKIRQHVFPWTQRHGARKEAVCLCTYTCALVLCTCTCARVLVHVCLCTSTCCALRRFWRPLACRREDSMLMTRVELALILVYTCVLVIKACNDSGEACVTYGFGGDAKGEAHVPPKPYRATICVLVTQA